MLDEKKVRVYAWFIRQWVKTIDQIPSEYQQTVTDYNVSLTTP